jgi:hypothetical protein
MLAQRETMKQRHNKPKDEKTVSREDAPPAALVKYAKELKAGAKLEKALAKLKAMAEAAPQSADHNKKPRQKTAPAHRPRQPRRA